MLSGSVASFIDMVQVLKFRLELGRRYAASKVKHIERPREQLETSKYAL